MIDQERAERMAALRAKRGQAPAVTPMVETPTPIPFAFQPPTSKPFVAPTGRTRRPHPAVGARILASGIAASAVFGLTTVIAAASQPASVAPSPTSTLPPATVPPTTVPATTLSPQPQTIVLTIPPLATVATPAAPVFTAPAAPVPAATAAAAPTPVPAAAAKPKPKSKPAPAPAAAPAPPAPPATSKPSAP